MKISKAPLIEQGSKTESSEEPGDESLSAFAHDTSIHGFKYLFGTHFIRKFVWFLLFGAAVLLAGIQVKQKIDQFAENPIMTNIDIEYTTEMAFPAVAICNTNQYRITATANDLYSMITSIYERGSTYKNLDTRKYQKQIGLVENKFFDSREYMKHAAHQIEDMLLDCRWPNNSQCSTKDFNVFYTDYGICYQINFDQSNPHVVYGAGTDKGLYMLINLEAYEHMAGPDQTTGLKIVIYNQTNIPLVAYKAIDVPPGYHAQIAMNYLERQKVNKKEGGNCVDQYAQEYFTQPQYSVETCRLNKLFMESQSFCNCKSYNTPERETTRTENITSTNYCNIEQHFKCVINHQELSGQSFLNCTENCTSVSFPVTLSFAKLPLSVMLQQANLFKAKMFQHHDAAVDERARHQADLVEAFNEIHENLMNAKHALVDNHLEPNANFSNLFQRFINFRFDINSTETCCMNQTKQDSNLRALVGDPDLLQGQGDVDRSLKGNPSGPGDAAPGIGGSGGSMMNKVQQKYITFFKPELIAYPVFAQYAKLEKKPDAVKPPDSGSCGCSNNAQNSQPSSDITKDFLKLQPDELLGYIFDILYPASKADRLKKLNFTQMMDEMQEIADLFSKMTDFYNEGNDAYQKTNFYQSPSDDDYVQIFRLLKSYRKKEITKKNLAEEALKHTGPFMDRFKEYMKPTLDNLFNLNQSLRKQLESIHASALNFTTDQWELFQFYLTFTDEANLDGCRNADVGYNVCLRRVRDMKIFLPNGSWKNDIWRCLLEKQDFFGLQDMTTAQTSMDSIAIGQFSQYCTTIIVAFQTAFPNGTSDPGMFVDSFHGPTFAEWNKTHSSSKNTKVDAKQRRNRQAPSSPPKLSAATTRKTYTMKEKYCMSQWYTGDQFINFAPPTSCRLKPIVEIFKYWKTLKECSNEMFSVMGNLTNQLQTVKDQFLLAMKDFDTHLVQYLQLFEMHDNFFSDNILSVNIYYADLSRQKYVQARVYDLWSLFCDIGGTSGLFLGASILSFAEIMDWVIFAFFLRKFCGYDSEVKTTKTIGLTVRPSLPSSPDFGGRRRTMSNAKEVKKVTSAPLDPKKEPRIEIPPTPVHRATVKHPPLLPPPISPQKPVPGVPGDKYFKF